MRPHVAREQGAGYAVGEAPAAAVPVRPVPPLPLVADEPPAGCASCGCQAGAGADRDPGPTVPDLDPSRGAPPPLPPDAAPPVTDEATIARAAHFDLDDPTSGLPILDEVPELGGLLQDLRQVDRLVASCVSRILTLQTHGVAVATTGVGLDTWMSIVGRRTGADVRMLRTAARLCERLPSLAAGFASGELSWSQVRSIVLAAERLPRHLDDAIDAAIADGTERYAEAHPDEVTRTIRWMLTSLDPTPTDEDQQAAEAEEYLALQPRLDGTGGRFWGEAGPVEFAALDAAVNHGAAAPGGSGREGFAGDRPAPSEDGRPGAAWRQAGRDRLHRLIDLLDTAMAGTKDATSGDRRSRPKVLLRADLDTLLDRDQVPAKLLTTLLGGHVTVTAGTARRLLDDRGADVRTVIIDATGAVVGVGRQRRFAPGWLRDAVLALHDTCSAPGCQTAAPVCEMDHATPWHPTRPDRPPGRTDVDQLAPLCRRDNAAKEDDGWTATQLADGRRRWEHRRSGLATWTLPVAPSRRPRPG